MEKTPAMHKVCRLRADVRSHWDRLAAMKEKPKAPEAINLVCIHRGEWTGETRECAGCQGAVQIKLFACAVHGACSMKTKLEDVACCVGCAEREE